MSNSGWREISWPETLSMMTVIAFSQAESTSCSA